jgi:hypothetical protein
MRKIISEALEYIVGIVVVSFMMGCVKWGALALLTADVPDVRMKAHDRSTKVDNP